MIVFFLFFPIICLENITFRINIGGKGGGELYPYKNLRKKQRKEKITNLVVVSSIRKQSLRRVRSWTCGPQVVAEGKAIYDVHARSQCNNCPSEVTEENGGDFLSAVF